MPWVTITSRELAKKLGVNYRELEQKHGLIEQIVEIRTRKGITQSQLARKLGVSQSRVAKIESVS